MDLANVIAHQETVLSITDHYRPLNSLRMTHNLVVSMYFHGEQKRVNGRYANPIQSKALSPTLVFLNRRYC